MAMQQSVDHERDDLEASLDMLGLEGENRYLKYMPRVKLLDHQVIAAAWMCRMEDGLPGGGLLADECGIGKTYEVLAAVCHQMEAYEDRRDDWEAGGRRGEAPAMPGMTLVFS